MTIVLMAKYFGRFVWESENSHARITGRLVAPSFPVIRKVVVYDKLGSRLVIAEKLNQFPEHETVPDTDFGQKLLSGVPHGTSVHSSLMGGTFVIVEGVVTGLTRGENVLYMCEDGGSYRKVQLGRADPARLPDFSASDIDARWDFIKNQSDAIDSP